MDKDHLEKLLEIARSPTDYKVVQSVAAKLLAEYGVEWPHNGCAANLSTLLRQAGIDVPPTVGAGRLAYLLGGRIGSRNWEHVPVGSQQPGDVGVTFDETPPEGSDHVYLVVECHGDDRMTIADNQSAALHDRRASGRPVPGGKAKTPTDYFLRAPMAGTSIGDIARVASFARLSGGVAPISLDPIDEIIGLARKSPLMTYEWANRGRAPAGYIKGMAVAWARTYAKWKNNDAAALAMAAADKSTPATDALSWYSDLFVERGMSNAAAGADTLRHLFVLLTGLGMRESSGRYCEGRDRSVSNTTGATAEAGLFQMSWNAAAFDPLMKTVFTEYADHTDLIEVFKEGVVAKASDLENFGKGDGLAFQRLAKTCPAFAVEFAALGLRFGRKHWGPINTRKAELRSECDNLFRAVQDLVDARGYNPEDL